MTEVAPVPSSTPVGEITLEAGSGGFGGAENEATALGIRQQTQFGDVRRRFFRHKLAVVGLIMVGIVVLAAIASPLIATQAPKAQDLTNTLQEPSSAHWFGTDELGAPLCSFTVPAA